MKVTKTMLATKFQQICQLIGVPCGIAQALKEGKDEYATLSYDSVHGGYLPIMKNIARGTESGFMRFSSCDKRKPLSKLYDSLCEWNDVLLYVKENGLSK